MREWLQSLLSKLKAGLAEIYGPRLQGVFLYGSQARGDATDGSDVDVLIVLDDLADYDEELRRTSELGARLSLEYDTSVSKVFLPEDDWRRKDSPFLMNVRREGIPA